MKKIILISLIILACTKISGQTYCLTATKTSETATKVTFSFSLTSSGANFFIDDYSFQFSPLSGITGANHLAGGSSATTPINLGSKEFDKVMGATSASFSTPQDEVFVGITQLSRDNGCTVLSNLALPLEWLSFNAKVVKYEETQLQVALEWVTADEKDVQNFSIERSEDAKTFYTIKKDIAANNTPGKHTYSDIDNRPITGISYYRVRQTDYDGKSTVTKIQSVSLSEQKTIGKFVFYPNPVRRGTPLSILTDVQGEYTFKVIDIAGRIVYFAKLQGGNTELKNLSLKGGTYFYEVLSGSQHINGKILVAE